jgi:cellobiose phosphorylase
MFHLMALHGANADAISYETDRMRFIGRGNDLVHPAAMQNLGALSDTEGSVLDPVVAIRFQITLEPEQTATLDMVTGIATTRESCLRLIEKYQDRHLAERVVDLSWTHSQVVLRQLNISEKDAQLYAILANSVIYVNSLLRANQDILRQNARGQSGLELCYFRRPAYRLAAHQSSGSYRPRPATDTGTCLLAFTRARR